MPRCSGAMPPDASGASSGEGPVPAFLAGLPVTDARRLMGAGVEDERDVASLSLESLSKIVCGPCTPALLELRARGQAELDTAMAAPLVGAVRAVFPSSAAPASGAVQPPKVHPRAADVQGPAVAT